MPDTEAEPAGEVDHDDADAAGLRGDGETPDRRVGAGEGRGEADVGLVVEEAEAVGADHADVAGSRRTGELALERETGLAHLGEARGDDDRGAGSGVGRLLDARRHLLGWDGDDDQVDRPGRVLERAERGDAADRLGGAVDDDEVAREAALHDRLDDGGADAGAVVAGADDRHPVRAQERGEGGGLGPGLAGVGGPERRLGEPGVHLDRDDALVEVPGHLEAGIEEDAQHPDVLGEHVRGEPPYAGGPCGGREVLQQQGADAVAAQRVRDQEGHLGVVVRPLGGGQPDQRVVLPEPQRQHAPAVVLGEQVVDVVVARLPAHPEEAQAEALQADLVVQCEEGVAVALVQRAYDAHGAVGQQHVGRGRRNGGRGGMRVCGGVAGVHDFLLGPSSVGAGNQGRALVPGPVGRRPLCARQHAPCAGTGVRRREEVAAMLVRDVMTTQVVTVRPETHVKAAIELLDTHRITAMPVVDDDDLLVGVVSEADVLRGALLPDRRAHEIPVHVDGRTGPLTVGDVMTREVMSVTADADLAAAASVLVDTHVKSLPVVDHGRVVGVVSRRDVIAVLARRDPSIRADVTDLLRSVDVDCGVEVVDGVVRIDGPLEPHAREIARVLAGTVPGVVGVAFSE